MIDVFSGHACQGSTQHDMRCFCSDLLFCLGLFLSSSFLPPLINQLNLTVASDHYFWHLLLRAPKLLPQLGFVGPFLAGVFHRHLGICLHQRARGGEGGQRAARSLIMEVSLPWLDARRNLSGGQGKTVFYRNFFTSFVTNIEAYISVHFNKETLFHCDGDGAPAQVAQRGCRGSSYIQKPSGCGPVLHDPTWTRGSTRWPPEAPSKFNH